MADRLEHSCFVVVAERQSLVEIAVHRSVGNLGCRLERIECCFRRRIGMMAGKRTDRYSVSECIADCKMVGRQMDRMVEHLERLQLVAVVEHRKIHSLEGKLEHIEH